MSRRVMWSGRVREGGSIPRSTRSSRQWSRDGSVARAAGPCLCQPTQDCNAWQS
jgi:hypothetical protein